MSLSVVPDAQRAYVGQYNDRVNVQLWDCSGDPKYQSCLPAIAKDVNGYLARPVASPRTRELEKGFTTNPPVSSSRQFRCKQVWCSATTARVKIRSRSWRSGIKLLRARAWVREGPAKVIMRATSSSFDIYYVIVTLLQPHMACQLWVPANVLG
eukprot:1194909-Prorocentrum_minimum.AAC.7